MENRKRNVQIIVRVTEEERALIEEKMKQIPTPICLCPQNAYRRVHYCFRFARGQSAYGAASENRREHQSDCKAYQRNRAHLRRRYGRGKAAYGRSVAIGASAASAIQGAYKMRVWDNSQQSFCRAKYGTGYPVPML